MHRSLLGAGREQPLLLRGAKAAADRDRPATVSASEGESEQKSECSKRRNCSRRSDAVGWLVGAAQVKVGPGPGPTDRPTNAAGRPLVISRRVGKIIFKMALSKNSSELSESRAYVYSRTTLVLDKIHDNFPRTYSVV